MFLFVLLFWVVYCKVQPTEKLHVRQTMPQIYNLIVICCIGYIIFFSNFFLIDFLLLM